MGPAKRANTRLATSWRSALVAVMIVPALLTRCTTLENGLGPDEGEPRLLVQPLRTIGLARHHVDLALGRHSRGVGPAAENRAERLKPMWNEPAAAAVHRLRGSAIPRSSWISADGASLPIRCWKRTYPRESPACEAGGKPSSCRRSARDRRNHHFAWRLRSPPSADASVLCRAGFPMRRFWSLPAWPGR